MNTQDRCWVVLYYAIGVVQWSDCSTTGTVSRHGTCSRANTRSVRPSDTARSRLSACLTHCLRPSTLSSWVAAALSRDHSSRRVLHWTGSGLRLVAAEMNACRAVLLANMARLVVPDRSRRLIEWLVVESKTQVISDCIC
ncbi:hypothetical protein BASA81_017326 [Batrachochytrium salamandrivorans]|nr:hypothetical protein BASA81_017326 [Batrachochytrium salamandrivorans]